MQHPQTYHCSVGIRKDPVSIEGNYAKATYHWSSLRLCSQKWVKAAADHNLTDRNKEALVSMSCTPAISQCLDVKDLCALSATKSYMIFTDVWIGSNNLLSIQLKNKSEHSMRRRMLGALATNMSIQRFIELNRYKIDGKMSNSRVNQATIARTAKTDFSG
jgi:hypothetical protein